MKKRKKITGNIRFPGWAFLILTAVYYETLLHFWTVDEFSILRYLQVALFSAAFGGLLGLAASLLPPKAGKWTSFALGLVLAVLYMVNYFVHDAFQVFMAVQTMLAGAGGVAGTFMNTVVSLVVNNLWRIGLALLPVVLYAVFAQPVKMNWKDKGMLALVAVLTFVLSFLTVCAVGTDVPVLKENYAYDSAVRCFGLPMALTLDTSAQLGGGEQDLDFDIPADTTPSTTAPQVTEDQTQPSETEETEPPTEPPIVYEEHTLGLDFASLAESEKNSNVSAIHSYIASLTPAMENEYTGLFEGKNLILITAEAFTGVFIDPELTPTLYRLSTEGIQFTDYYQPGWGAGTTGGEYSNVVGLMPLNGSCMKEAMQQDLFLTMGNQLQKLGYTSAAFHNNDYTYYSRHQTHTLLGYDVYMGHGNGIEAGVKATWPESDLEMVDYTLPMYIDKQPFSLYYMTVSGHSNYSRGANAMSEKNYDLVKDLDCSETIKCYIAAQLELENALTSMLAQLEEAGILDDTVIVISSDHYPYGLEKSSTWGSSKDYLSELFGESASSVFVRDQNTLVIWSGCVEDMDIVVDDPVFSLDILPTLSNLFGVEYDSRLLPGRDVLGDEEPIIFWSNYSWKTDKGRYSGGKFTPAEGVEVEEGYVDRINAIVKNKIKYCKAVCNYDYYDYVVEALEELRLQQSLPETAQETSACDLAS